MRRAGKEIEFPFPIFITPKSLIAIPASVIVQTFATYAATGGSLDVTAF